MTHAGARGTDEVGAKGAPSALMVAAVVALVLTAIVEAARVPWFGNSRGPLVRLGAFALSLTHVVQDLLPAVSFLPLLAATLPLEARAPRAAAAARVLLAGLVLGAAYRDLVRYPDFAAYPPVWGGFALLFAVVLATVFRAERRLGRDRLSRTLAVLWPIGLVLGAVAAHVADMVAFKADYPTLHLCLLHIAHLLLALGVWRAGDLPRLKPLYRHGGIAVAAGVGASAFAFVVSNTELGRGAYRYWAAHTTLGQSQTVFRTYEEPKGDGTTRDLTEAEARGLFDRHHNLPHLPPDFDLGRYNVLLLMTEALRFDETALHDPAAKTTPELARFLERGAFGFTRAYAGSSGTLQSVASLLGMSYPSFLELELWYKPWHGRLRDARPGVAELFRDAGYETFWMGHNHEACFQRFVLGFDEGFERVAHLSLEESRRLEADELLAARALAMVRELSSKRSRFFGWVFFGSPHGPYEARFEDWPSSSARERYRQEVRYNDEQIGEVLRGLSELGRLEDTIVIYTADHGEEFRDHGGTYHKSTLYGEVTRVPLAIWVPGLRGEVVAEPTSTIYVFPWLLSHGSPAMRAAVAGRLASDFGPVLARTDGAVVAELLGPHRMLTTLVYPTTKFNYDHNSQLYEAYRLDADPFEQRDLADRDPALAEAARSRMEAFRRVRADRRRYVYRPDLRTAPLDQGSK